MRDNPRVTSRILALLLVMLIITCAFPTSYAQSIPDIMKVPELRPGSAYSISSAEGLRRLAELVNSGMNMKNINFVLNADIVLNPGSFDETACGRIIEPPSGYQSATHFMNSRANLIAQGTASAECTVHQTRLYLFGRITVGRKPDNKNSYIRGVYWA